MNKKKRICCHRGIKSESERKLKTGQLDLARKLKKLWNMKVTVKSIEAGAFAIVAKNLEKRPGKLEF